MKDEQDYIQNLADIRSMMERSSKFLSLSGWAGIMAGIYALAGAWIAWKFFDFNPGEPVSNSQSEAFAPALGNLVFLALIILVLSVSTAVFLSSKKAHKKGENVWNPIARRLFVNMAVPLITGGLLILILIIKGLIAFIAPFTLLFYGLALYNASKFTYEEVKTVGLIEIALGLLSAWFVDYGLLFWALGFGIVHIIYGIYMHYRYER
jgi:uncharacterized membrane protein